MTTDTTGAALLAIIRDNPADWDARRVYADWLDDGSEEGAMRANGMRWQAWKRKYPLPTTYGEHAWHNSDMLYSDAHSLPSHILDWMHAEHAASLPPGYSKPYRPAKGWPAFYYRFDPTPDAAEAALARALWALGIQAAQ